MQTKIITIMILLVLSLQAGIYYNQLQIIKKNELKTRMVGRECSIDKVDEKRIYFSCETKALKNY